MGMGGGGFFPSWVWVEEVLPDGYVPVAIPRGKGTRGLRKIV
jgi:hypothetical protein